MKATSRASAVEYIADDDYEYEDDGPSEFSIEAEVIEQQLERSQRAIIAGHRRAAFDAVDRAMDAVRRLKVRA